MVDGGQHRVAVVVEDDADIRNLLEAVLGQAGFTTYSAADGLSGVEAVREHQPVVTTLDISLPGIDGFEVARRIRAFSSTYIVMLTARGEEIDVLVGLEAGADDYLTKPFRPRELRARIEAMLRRPRTVTTVPTDDVASGPAATASPAAAPEGNGWLEHDGLRLNEEMRLVERNGERVELTRSEFELLMCIMDNGHRVVSKSTLALAMRAEGGNDAIGDYVSDSDRRAVEVHLANLRRKLGDESSQPRWIETVRGVGYRLVS
ncbi:MAG TPA: response regulator transcription factor [Humibacter sp.]|nr:response regulator transcription factor [Humibacter sp.]